MRIADGQEPLGEFGRRADLDRLAVQKCVPATAAGEKFVTGGSEDEAGFDRAVDDQRDRHAPAGEAADKRLSAVDRVHHPEIFGIAKVSAAGFLAQKSVAGKAPFQTVADQVLGRHVGLTHHVLEAF